MEIKDISFDEYRKSKSINVSGLKTILFKSPFHYLWERDNDQEPSKAQQLGTFIHKAILEPKDWFDNYVCEPEVNRRTKAGKEELEQFREQNPDKIHVPTYMYATAELIRKKISDRLLVMSFLEDCKKEVSVFSEFETIEQKIEAKCRPDAVNFEKGYIIDIKTTTDASYSAFKRSIFSYKYHMQAAFYLELCKCSSFYFIACETNPPYEIGFYQLSEELIQEGQTLCFEAIGRYIECLSSGEFPSYEFREIGP